MEQWPATPAEHSSDEVLVNHTVVLPGQETATLTGPAGDHVSGAGLIGEWREIIWANR